MAAEVRAFSRQSTASNLLPANPSGSPSPIIILIFTPSHRDLAKPHPPLPCFFVFCYHSHFPQKTTARPGVGVLRPYVRIRSEFGKIRDLESLRSSVSILYIHTCSRHRRIAQVRGSQAAQNRLFRLGPHQVRGIIVPVRPQWEPDWRRCGETLSYLTTPGQHPGCQVPNTVAVATGVRNRLQNLGTY